MRTTILSLFAVLFFVAGCGGLDDLINELDDEIGYECYHGDVVLPSGTYPEHLITPEGYEWKCEGGTAHNIRFYSNGTWSGSLTSEAFSNLLEYWHDCGNHPGGLELTGEWVVDETDRLCLHRNNIQPGLYGCQEITYESGTFTSSAYEDIYDSNGDFLGREYSDYGADICALVKE